MFYYVGENREVAHCGYSLAPDQKEFFGHKIEKQPSGTVRINTDSFIRLFKEKNENETEIYVFADTDAANGLPASMVKSYIKK